MIYKMKKFKKILAGSLAVLSIMSISPVYGVKPFSGDVPVEQMEDVHNQNFKKNIVDAYSCYGVKNFREAVKSYPEIMSDDKIKAIKTLFNNIESKKALVNRKTERILRDSCIFDDDTVMTISGTLPKGLKGFTAIGVKVPDNERKEINLPQIVAGFMTKCAKDVDGRDIGSGPIFDLDVSNLIRINGRNYHYFHNSSYFKMLSANRTFQLSSVCVCSKGKFLCSFVRSDDGQWYKHDAYTVVPVDESEVMEMKARHPEYVFSFVQI